LLFGRDRLLPGTTGFTPVLIRRFRSLHHALQSWERRI